MSGFRYGVLSSGGSPFNCDTCTETDRKARNCGNYLGLSDEVLAVTEYTPLVTSEIEEKGAAKVVSLGDIRLYECPASFITLDTAELMRLTYLVESSGSLLHAGGWGEQSAWLVEAFDIYKSESLRNMVKEDVKRK